MTTQFTHSLGRWLLAAMAGLFMASCATYDDGYYADGPGYGGGYPGGGYAGGGYSIGGQMYYDDWGSDYYGYYPPVYRSYITYSSAWPHYYGGRYYSHRWWNDRRYRHYAYDYGSNRDRYRNRRSSEEMKLVRYRGPERGQLPRGYHSDQWYKDRGYSLRGNTYRQRDGDMRGRQPSSSSSSSRPRSEPDPRPTSEHPRAIRQPESFRFTGSGAASRSADRRDVERREVERREMERRASSSQSSANRSSNTRGSASPRSSSSRDTRPTSDHPRALRQPEKYKSSSEKERENKEQRRNSQGKRT